MEDDATDTVDEVVILRHVEVVDEPIVVDLREYRIPSTSIRIDSPDRVRLLSLAVLEGVFLSPLGE